jgi:hypothetical protein
MVERVFDALARFSLCALGVAALVLVTVVPTPADALQQVASMEEVAQDRCARQVYQGLTWGAKPDRCDQGLFPLPASASLKCNLYRETGYPSSLMRKACQLFDRGLIEFFIEGAEAQR